MTEPEFERFSQIASIKEEAAEHCTLILNRLMEELPIEKIARDAVRKGETSPNLLTELFGVGEGAGWSKTEGRTLKEALAVWYEARRMMQKILDESCESPD